MGQVTGPTSLKFAEKKTRIREWKRKLARETWTAYGNGLCCADCGVKKGLQLTKQNDDWKTDFYLTSWVRLFSKLRQAGFPLKECFKLLCRKCTKARRGGKCRRCKKNPLDRTDRVHCSPCREGARVAKLALKLELLQAYSKGKCVCACCGENYFPFLQLDHVNGDGYLDRRNGLYGSNLYRSLRTAGYPDKHRFAVLCGNCNFAKAWNNNVCPCHERRVEVSCLKRRKKK